MIVKKHRAPGGRLVLAVCDDDILGKRFSEGELQLDLSSNFYDGAKMTEEETEKLFRSASIINFVGKKAVRLGLKSKLISESRIITISGIPHAQAAF